MTQPPEITYSDELLADGTVHRRYSDGRNEWRSRGTDGRIHWRDDRGDSGTDERLGRDLVKRSHTDGRTGYGWTEWNQPPGWREHGWSYLGDSGADLTGPGGDGE